MKHNNKIYFGTGILINFLKIFQTHLHNSQININAKINATALMDKMKHYRTSSFKINILRMSIPNQYFHLKL